jgi:preprotein translocase subunit SecG
MIAIASILLILAVLVQSPKSGMAANFGAANQTMGVRQTTDFLEKFTWSMIAAIVFFCLLSVVTLSTDKKESTKPAPEATSAEQVEAMMNKTADEDLTVEADANADATETETETAGENK